LRIAILNGYGSTVGDNLEHRLLANHLKAKGHDIIHLWNFNTQTPEEVRKADALIVGPAGVIWYGNEVRNRFFLDVIEMSEKACGVGLGYNMEEPLNKEWTEALNKLDFITVRDPYTYHRLTEILHIDVYNLNSLAWIFKPLFVNLPKCHEIGIIMNREANKMNYGTEQPLNLRGMSHKEIPFDGEDKDAQHASEEIQKCKTILAWRLHGFILALLNRVPAIVVDDLFKAKFQAEIAEYPIVHTVGYLKDLNAEKWAKLIKTTMKTDTKPYVARMRKLASFHLDILDAWLCL